MKTEIMRCHSVEEADRVVKGARCRLPLPLTKDGKKIGTVTSVRRKGKNIVAELGEIEEAGTDG